MVSKILGFFSKETGTLNQAALLLGLFAFLSQILAFLRDRLLAHIFGAGIELDIYYAAFRVPDFIFVTAASVVSISVLIPFIIERDALGRDKLKEFINNVFSFFGVLIVVVSVVAYFLMPTLAEALYRGMSPWALEQVVFLSRVLLFSPIILGFSNLFGALTQAYNRFAIYALAPLLYNVGIIVGIILLGESIGVLGVALGVVLGALMHALIQVPFVIKSGLFPRFNLHIDFVSIKMIAKISLPRTVTLAMSSVALLFLTAFASLMGEGSISILTFSINLQSVPLALIGISYSLAAFPTLTRRFQENNLKGFVEQVALTTRFIIFWSLPLTALLIVLRAQVVRVILGTGMFDWNATRLTAAALALFVLSSVFQSLILLFMRGFYSAGFTKKPFIINLFSTAFIFVAAYGLVKLFYASEIFPYFVGVLLKVEDLPNIVVLMLPLAFSLGTILNGVILWIVFEKQFNGFSRKVMQTLFQTFGVSVIMGAVAYWGLGVFGSIFSTETLFGLFFQGLAAGIISILAGIVLLVALGNREIADIWSVIKGRFWKAKVIATDPEIV
jgi:putative peptidoglycan lipid II flippase